MDEADPQQAVQHLAREFGSVPDVGDLEARHQFEGFGPVGARVAGDRRLGVALGPVLHVAGLGGSADCFARLAARSLYQRVSSRRDRATRNRARFRRADRSPSAAACARRAAAPRPPRWWSRRTARDACRRATDRQCGTPGFSGTGGTSFAFSSSGSANRSSISSGLKPVS